MAGIKTAQFGALLLHSRAAAGLTQEQLAARAGVSPDTIAALERGRRRAPRGATVEMLASALGLDGDVRAAFATAARDATMRAATPRGSLDRLAALAASPPTP